MTNRKEELKLGEILVRKGWISPPILEEALSRQKVSRDFLGQILISEGRITDEKLAMALSEQSGIPFLRLSNLYVDWAFVLKFSTALVLEQKCFPVRQGDGDYVFAVTNPLDAWALAQIEAEARGYKIRLVLVAQRDMKELMTRYREYVNIRVRKKLESDQS